MPEMSTADVELVYRHLNDYVRGDIEYEAFEAAYDALDDATIDRLEEASDDSESAFDFVFAFEFQRGNLEREELFPLAGVEPNDEPDVYDDAHELGWEMVRQIQTEIKRLQESTNYSPREFVAMVLYYSALGEDEAATVMDISVGNYRGKLGNIREKREKAKATTKIADQLQK